MTDAPNPLARLVAELPGLREHMMDADERAQLDEWCATIRQTNDHLLTVQSGWVVDYIERLIGASSAYAIAIEAIELAERYAKALSDITHVCSSRMREDDDWAHDVDRAYCIARDTLKARAAPASEPDRRNG